MDFNPDDKQSILKSLRKNEIHLKDVSEEYRKDKDVVLEALYASKKEHVWDNGYVLEYAAKNLCNDKEVMLVAVRKNGYECQYASIDLKSDKEILLEAIKNDAWALGHASKELKANKEIVLEAMKKDLYVLSLAPMIIQDDKEVLLLLKKQYEKAETNLLHETHKKWFDKRMQKLDEIEILETDELMRKDIQDSQVIKLKKRKF